MYRTPNELSRYSSAWPCAHFRLAGGVNALAGVLFLFDIRNEGLDLSIVQLKWLGWDYNKVELLITERDNNTMAPNLDKVEILPRGWLNSYDLLET